MHENIILLNIGNTHTQMAYCENGTIGKVVVLKTELVEPSLFEPDSRIVAACVVPEVKEKLSGLNLFFLDGTNAKSVDFSLVDASHVGADRVANAIEAAAEYRLPALVLDFGSAITAEIVDGGKRFRGGAIAPGRVMMRRALNFCTGQLPLTELEKTPPETAGVNTTGAITFGIDRGVVGMVREWLRLFQREYGEFQSVAGVGGDADFFCRELPEITPGGEKFTLKGLLKGWQEQ